MPHDDGDVVRVVVGDGDGLRRATRLFADHDGNLDLVPTRVEVNVAR